QRHGRHENVPPITAQLFHDIADTVSLQTRRAAPANLVRVRAIFRGQGRGRMTRRAYIVLPKDGGNDDLPPSSMLAMPFLLADFADETGLVAVGGDLRPERLLQAYRHGVFPWYDEHQPICWWSPDPRAIIELDGLHVSRRLRRTVRSGRFAVTA